MLINNSFGFALPKDPLLDGAQPRLAFSSTVSEVGVYSKVCMYEATLGSASLCYGEPNMRLSKSVV